MSLKIDRGFFEELGLMSIMDVCKRSLCSYDDVKKSYIVEAWGEIYRVSPDTSEILDYSNNPVNREAGLVMLFYLMRAKNILVSGEWISEKDIPGGVTFFTGPHAVPANLITGRYGNDIDAFSRACRGLGGVEVKMGDAAFVMPIVRRIPVVVLLWKGDDEFGPDARLLFDRTVSEHLPLDVIFALSLETLRRISSYKQG